MAIPICSFRRSHLPLAPAMSGLRSTAVRRNPQRHRGGEVVNFTGGIASSAGALPVRMAMPCFQRRALHAKVHHLRLYGVQLRLCLATSRSDAIPAENRFCVSVRYSL